MLQGGSSRPTLLDSHEISNSASPEVGGQALNLTWISDFRLKTECYDEMKPSGLPYMQDSRSCLACKHHMDTFAAQIQSDASMCHLLLRGGILRLAQMIHMFCSFKAGFLDCRQNQECWQAKVAPVMS